MIRFFLYDLNARFKLTVKIRFDLKCFRKARLTYSKNVFGGKVKGFDLVKYIAHGIIYLVSICQDTDCHPLRNETSDVVSKTA